MRPHVVRRVGPWNFDLVTEELEAAIREVAEINFIESTSRAGVSIITLELKAAVTDPAPVWSEIRDKISNDA